jgi:hypothetical protein
MAPYQFANAFSVGLWLVMFTQGWNNPGLKLANAFGVTKLNQYHPNVGYVP